MNSNKRVYIVQVDYAKRTDYVTFETRRVARQFYDDKLQSKSVLFVDILRGKKGPTTITKRKKRA